MNKTATTNQEAQMATATITPTSRRRITKRLHGLNALYHQAVPLDDLFDILSDEGLSFDDCILCGATGHTTLALTSAGAEVPNMLVLDWCRMDSGRYEVTSYLS
jgi:hypothetical protein